MANNYKIIRMRIEYILLYFYIIFNMAEKKDVDPLNRSMNMTKQSFNMSNTGSLYATHNPVNNSKSKQMYSFSKSRRFV